MFITNYRCDSPARRVVLALLIAQCASACTGPLRLGTPSPLPQRYQEQPPSQDIEEKKLDDTQLAEWWIQFEDPILGQLVTRALEHNLDLAIALARVDQARAGIRATESQLWPSIGVGLQAGANFGDPTLLEFQEFLGVNDLNAKFWRVGLQTQWEIDLFGRGRARVVAARALTSAAAGDAEAVRLSVAATVADLYLTLRGLQQQLVLLEQSHQVATDFVVIAEHSFTAGVVLGTDVDVARAGLAQVEARQRDVTEAVTHVRLMIELLCVTDPGALAGELNLGNALPQILPDIMPGQPVDLLMRRPDLIAAQARLLATMKESDAARLNYWPTLSLSALLARNGWTIAGQGLGASTFWLFGGALMLPLIDFGARKSVVEAADAQAQQAFIAYEKAAAGALFDVEQALARLRRQRAVMAKRGEEVAQRSEVLRKAQEQYRVGDIGRIDIDRARVELLGSQSALLTERVGLLQAQVALFRAMGGGWHIPDAAPHVSN